MQTRGQLNSTVSNNLRVAIPYANEPSRQGMWSRIFQFFFWRVWALARDTATCRWGAAPVNGRNGNDRHPTGIHTSHVMCSPFPTFRQFRSEHAAARRLHNLIKNVYLILFPSEKKKKIATEKKRKNERRRDVSAA